MFFSRRICALLVPIVLAGGCASLDPSDDISRAVTLVGERSGHDPAWMSEDEEHAQLWAGADPLDSETAVRVAMYNNQAIRAEVESITAARADYVQAHLLPNPVIRFAYGFPTDGMGGQPLAAAAVQQLTWLWRRPDAIDAADAALRARVLSVSDQALSLVARIRTLHAEVLRASDAAALQAENVELWERTFDLFQARFEVGEASGLDLNRVELDLHEARVALADREAALHTAKRRLLAEMGMAGLGTHWEAARSISEVAPTLGEDQVMTLALANRLDVAAAEALVEARAAGISLEEQGAKPDVSAGIGYEQNFSDRPGVFPSISVTPKLFDDNSARIAKAHAEFRQAQLHAEGIRQAALREVRTVWIKLRNQQTVARAYRDEIIGVAQNNHDLARQAFDAGEADLTVMLESQRLLNSAQLTLVDRELERDRLLFELERAAGGTLELDAVVARSHQVVQ